MQGVAGALMSIRATARVRTTTRRRLFKHFCSINIAEDDVRPVAKPRSRLAMAADDFQIEQEAHVRNAAAAMASPKHANGAVNVQQESVQGDDILAEIESTLEWKRGEMINTEDAFEIMANHKIRVAMADGMFDNLKGAGKPLKLDNSDFATKLMKNANVLPSWIETGKELRRDLAAFRAHLRKGHRNARVSTPMSSNAESRLGDAVDKLNDRIKKYNLIAPVTSTHFPVLCLATELDNALTDTKATK